MTAPLRTPRLACGRDLFGHLSDPAGEPFAFFAGLGSIVGIPSREGRSRRHPDVAIERPGYARSSARPYSMSSLADGIRSPADEIALTASATR